MSNITDQIKKFKSQIKACEKLIDDGNLTLAEQLSTLDYHWTLQNEVFELEKEYFKNIYR